MSVVFDALKKGQAATVSPALSAPPAPFPVAATLLDAPTAMPLKGLALAALSGVLLAGGGAWLYWAGRAAVVSVPVQPLKVFQSATVSSAPG